MAELEHLIKKLAAENRPTLLQPFESLKADLDARGQLTWFYDWLAVKSPDDQPPKWTIILASPTGEVLLVKRPTDPAWMRSSRVTHCIYTSKLPLPKGITDNIQPAMAVEGRVGIVQLQDFDNCARSLMASPPAGPS